MGSEHIYRVAGKRVPGVTTITGNLGWGRDGLMWWANEQGLAGIELRDAREAASIGTIAHAAVEADILGPPVDLSKLPDDWREKVESIVARWKRWRAAMVGSVLLSETELVSPTLMYGGRLDMVFLGTDGRLWLCDLKTGGMYEEALVQCAGYAMLVEENTDYRIESYSVLRIRQDSESILTAEYPWDPKGEAAETFRLCLRLHALHKKLKKEV